MNDISIPITIFFLLALFVFFPRIGALAAWKRWKKANEREQIEDALKLLLMNKWQNRVTSPATLKAGLGVSDRRVIEVITRMADQELARLQGNELELTTTGERVALQITRAHRLMERYLADEARMPLSQIHKEAHRREHLLTPEQIDALDASLGHPGRDPHGDPIPDSQGAIHQPDTKPVSLLLPDQVGRVTRIENEPVIAYAQLQAQGIRLGQTLRIIESTLTRLVLTDGETEYSLAPVIAANINVEVITEMAHHEPRISLFQLTRRQPAEIIELDEACQGFTRRRFLDLGLTPGAVVLPELANPFGDPRAYRVRGTLIALRKDQAEQIWVKPITS